MECSVGVWSNRALRCQLGRDRLRGAGVDVGLTALRADLFFAQIVSRNWLPKRCAFGPMAPLNLRFAGGLLSQQERRDVDCV